MILKPQPKLLDESAIVRLSAARMVAVGSTNPVKIAAVRAVLSGIAPSARVDGVDVESCVAEQPWGDEETIRGARTRALAATLAHESIVRPIADSDSRLRLPTNYG